MAFTKSETLDTSQHLSDEIQKVDDYLAQMIAKADAESNGSFSKDEAKEFDGLTEYLETLQKDHAAKVEEEEADQLRQKKVSDFREQRRKNVSTRRTDIRVGQQKDNIEDDPKCGFKTHREFLTAVINAGNGTSPSRVDDRLKRLAAGADEQSTASDPYGGFLVPEGFITEPLSVATENDPTAGRTMQVPMDNPTVKIPARVDKNHSTSVTGGLTVARKAETVAGTSSRMTFEQVTLHANNLFGLAYATEELLTDSPTSFAAIIARGFDDEMRSHLLDEKINGTGVGEYEGVLVSPALVSVTKETGQAATTIVYENVIKMRARAWRYGNAIWLANHDTMPQLMLMNQAVGTGGQPVWQPSAREDHPDMLLGRPLFFTEYAKTLGTQGDLICANWAEYLEGEYQGMQSASSVHVRFVEHEQTFKVWKRNDGRGWWRTALTPKNGTNTLSPFVALATRS